MKHILFIVTSNNQTGTTRHPAGYEFSEIADPYHEFINRNCTVDFVSILGGKPPYVGYDENQLSSKKFISGSGFKRLNQSHKLSDVDISAYDAIFFPGGLGLMTDMVHDTVVNEAIRLTYESGNIVGAVCHGPAALLNVQLTDGSYLLKGKKVNSFTRSEEEIDNHKLGEIIPFMLEEELAKQGAVFSHTEPFEPYVVSDGNLVTGQNPASATGVAQKMIELLAENKSS